MLGEWPVTLNDSLLTLVLEHRSALLNQKKDCKDQESLQQLQVVHWLWSSPQRKYLHVQIQKQQGKDSYWSFSPSIWQMIAVFSESGHKNPMGKTGIDLMCSWYQALKQREWVTMEKSIKTRLKIKILPPCDFHFFLDDIETSYSGMMRYNSYMLKTHYMQSRRKKGKFNPL